MVQKALFRRPRVHWPFKYDATNVHFEQIQTGHLFFVVVVTQCLDPRQQGTVFKILDTQQSETLTNFPEIARLIPIRTQDICLEISSDCKYCLGLKVEATVVLGHRVKSQSFRHLENIQVHTQLPMNIHRNYQRNFTRVFSVRQEIPSDYKKRFHIVVDKLFSELALSVFFRILTHRYGFQNTRCPAVGNSRPICTKYLI